MNGAESMFAEAARRGMELCFANPGTTEMPMVAALDRQSSIKAVLGLHENVCTGAADGYARIAGKPAMSLLHLGPGFANGIANLHNARRAFSPLINLIGEHASWHLAADAPLHSDIESLARPVSRFVRRNMAASEMGRDLAEAHAAATSGRGGVASLILPHDHQLAVADQRPRHARAATGYPIVDADAVIGAARLLRRSERPLLLLGGNALFGAGLRNAGRIAAAMGALLVSEVGFAKLETGRGLPHLRRLPYFPEQAQALIDQHDGFVLVGSKHPVSFFGYADQSSRYLDGKEAVVALAGQEDDAAAALEALAAELDATQGHGQVAADMSLPEATQGALDPERLAAVLAALQPEECIVVLTAVTSAHAYSAITGAAAPHTQLALTGGAIGDGPAMALGAALAAPGRRVISLEADGSGAYIVQSLWSQAREQLPITTIICANRKYNILGIELARAGINQPGEVAQSLCSLDNPTLDWVSLARGFGVDACSVEDTDSLRRALERSLSAPGPQLIEAVL